MLEFFENAIMQAEARGRKREAIRLLTEMAHDHVISIAEGAKRSDMFVEEFSAKMAERYPGDE